jgi:hypothetical protein
MIYYVIRLQFNLSITYVIHIESLKNRKSQHGKQIYLHSATLLHTGVSFVQQYSAVLQQFMTVLQQFTRVLPGMRGICSQSSPRYF